MWSTVLYDLGNEIGACYVQAQTTGNVSQKIHQVPNGREMALDQSTAEIRKHSRRTSEGQFVKSFLPHIYVNILQ